MQTASDDDQGERFDQIMLSDLERQGLVDRRTIEGLLAQGVLDREVIAEQLAIQVQDREHIEQLKQALVTSRRIGAAIGIIMSTHRVTEEHAFRLLAEKSSRTNRKLREIANDVVETGSLSGYDDAPGTVR